MSKEPAGAQVRCPAGNELAIEIIENQSEVVTDEEEADGKVWTTCRKCGKRFLVYYRNEG